PCHWSSTNAKSAAMPAENARPFTSSPNESLIGSSPFQITPVDSTTLQVAMCPVRSQANLSKTPTLWYSLDLKIGTTEPSQSIPFTVPRPYTARSAPLSAQLVPDHRAAAPPDATLRNHWRRGLPVSATAPKLV